MKILELGDSHFSNRRPKGRLDENYLAVLMDKLDQVFDIYYEEHCDVIVQVGDFFNSIHMPDSVKAQLVYYLRKMNEKLLTIYGQHDIEGHSGTTYQNCPLHVLEAAGVIELLKPNLIFFQHRWSMLDSTEPASANLFQRLGRVMTSMF